MAGKTATIEREQLRIEAALQTDERSILRLYSRVGYHYRTEKFDAFDKSTGQIPGLKATSTQKCLLIEEYGRDRPDPAVIAYGQLAEAVISERGDAEIVNVEIRLSGNKEAYSFTNIGRNNAERFCGLVNERQRGSAQIGRR